jgi:anti-sigma regulatory factor (Ser/Thr protein kinase)
VAGAYLLAGRQSSPTDNRMDEQTFPGTLDSLEEIRKYVAEAARAVGFDSGATYNLCLAVDEIVTNVIVHGYEEAGLTGDIKIDSGTEGDKFVVRVKDRGKPYDPNAHQVPALEDLNLPLELRNIGGLGILLAKDAVDDLQYSSTNDGNTHRFVMLLPNAKSVLSSD